MIVPKAMEEIDAKKRDGRLGPHARAFNRLIGPSVLNGSPIVLREADPRVELSLALCARIPWSDYHELDPNDGDCRIVAEALHARNVDPASRVLLSHDIKPLAYARGRGLPVHQASDDWLRPVEPGPKDKEIQRLKQQVGDLRKTEPEFGIVIDVDGAEPFSVYSVGPLTTEQADMFAKAIRKGNPPKQEDARSGPFGIQVYDIHRDHSYAERYDAYVANVIPAFTRTFHGKLEAMYNQRLFSVRVTNTGTIRADHLVIAMTIEGGWINRRLVLVSPQGPPAPAPRSLLDANIPNMRDMMSPRVGRHEFDYTNEPHQSATMEVTCEDFRNGQDFIFEGVICPSPEPGPLTISISVTAANLHGKRTEVRQYEKSVETVAASSLFDLDDQKFIGDYPIRKEILRILEAKDKGRIEWDSAENDYF